MNRAYVVEIAPNRFQASMCDKSAHAARAIWNWGLATSNAHYRDFKKSLSAIDLHRILNQLKKSEFVWLYEVSKCAPQEALRDLDKAKAHFFRGLKTGKKIGFPKFKKRGMCRHSFRLTGSIKVRGNRLQLPRIGKVKLKEAGYLPEDAKINSVTVFQKADRWFASVQVDTLQPIPEPGTATGEVIGVDVGVQHLATTSDGRKYENPRPTARYEKRRRMLAKRVSRRPKQTNEEGRKYDGTNRSKAKTALARLDMRIANVRKDAIHKATTDIVSNASVIVVESLNVRGMMKNRRLSKALQDSAMGETLRQIKYKAAWKGAQVIEAPQFFASSKTCSCCGNKKDDLTLADRVYTCDVCGLVIDRDENAALNLKQLAGSSSVSAHCPASSGFVQTDEVKLVVGCEVNVMVS